MVKCNVVLFSGKAGAGKDTVADEVCKQLQAQGYSTVVMHYADLLKFICSKYFGWDGNKDEKGRSLLQRVGTDVIRKQEPDYWVCFIRHLLQLFPNEWDYVLIPDCRFENEISYMAEIFPTMYIRVVRADYISKLTIEQQEHSSETALDVIEPDIIFNNDSSLEELPAQVSTLTDWIKSKDVLRDV